MRHIALEEAFSVPEWNADSGWQDIPIDRELGAAWVRKLRDFTEYRLPEMDENGIDIQVLSQTVPGIQTDQDAASARDNARYANDYLARVVADHPTRFRGFAALPMQDPKAAVEELERAVRELGFCGALINNHLDGHYLDEPRYEELWSALEELSVPLYLHPGAPPADHWQVLRGRPEMYGAAWSWAAETGGHALRAVFGGVFDRHPAATLILGHMGEFLPFMRSRLDSRYNTFALENPLQHQPSHYIGTNIVITTSGVFSPATLTGAVLEIGADSVMFSIDYPYESSADSVAFLNSAPLPPDQLAQLAHGNADRVLRLPNA